MSNPTAEQHYASRGGPIGTFLKGKLCKPNHPATVLNPNGRDGFKITRVLRYADGRFAVRGDDTMWFGESAILEICDG